MPRQDTDRRCTVPSGREWKAGHAAGVRALPTGRRRAAAPSRGWHTVHSVRVCLMAVAALPAGMALAAAETIRRFRSCSPARRDGTRNAFLKKEDYAFGPGAETAPPARPSRWRRVPSRPRCRGVPIPARALRAQAGGTRGGRFFKQKGVWRDDAFLFGQPEHAASRPAAYAAGSAACRFPRAGGGYKGGRVRPAAIPGRNADRPPQRSQLSPARRNAAGGIRRGRTRSPRFGPANTGRVAFLGGRGRSGRLRAGTQPAGASRRAVPRRASGRTAAPRGRGGQGSPLRPGGARRQPRTQRQSARMRRTQRIPPACACAISRPTAAFF